MNVTRYLGKALETVGLKNRRAGTCLASSPTGRKIVSEVIHSPKTFDLHTVKDCVSSYGSSDSTFLSRAKRSLEFVKIAGLETGLKEFFNEAVGKLSAVEKLKNMKHHYIDNARKSIKTVLASPLIRKELKQEIQRASSYGVKLDCGANELEYAKKLNSVLVNLHKNAVPLPKKIIVVSPEHPMWKNKRTFGIFSIYSPDAIKLSPDDAIGSTFLHELGHLLHFKNNPDSFLKLCETETEGKLAELALKEFGLTNQARQPREFVAEVYRRHLENRLPKGEDGNKMIEYYYRLGGHKLPASPGIANDLMSHFGYVA